MQTARSSKKDRVTRPDVVAGVVFCIIVFASKAAILNLPYHWDEMSAYMTPAYWLAGGSLVGALPGFHPPFLYYGHPPALYLSVALLFKIFGEKIWIAHLFAISVSFLGVYFTYLLAARLSDRTTGLFAALFLFFTPLYFAQSGMVHADLLVTAVGVMCVYFFFQERFIAYLLCGLALVMVKESGAAIILAVVVYAYLAHKDAPGVARKVLKYSLPLLVLSLFFIWQKIATGMFLPNEYFGSHEFFALNRRSITWAFVKQGRIVLTVLIVIAFLLKRDAWKKEFRLFLLIFLLFVGTFSFIYHLPRYVLPVFPYYCILGAYAVALFMKDARLRFAVGAAVIALFIALTHGAGKTYTRGSFETDMRYVDVVLNHRNACNYIEKAFPGESVLARWPLDKALEYPFLGYVSRPVKVVTAAEPYDVVVYTRQGIPENAELLTMKNLRLDRVFKRKHALVEVYVKDTGSSP